MSLFITTQQAMDPGVSHNNVDTDWRSGPWEIEELRDNGYARRERSEKKISAVWLVEDQEVFLLAAAAWRLRNKNYPPLPRQET